MNQWLVGIGRKTPIPGGQTTRTVCVFPIERHEFDIAVEVMIDEGVEMIYVFKRAVLTTVVAEVLARGDSIVEAFKDDIEFLIFTEEDGH